MSQYRVRLESSVDSQAREVTAQADSEEAAVELVNGLERGYCEYQDSDFALLSEHGHTLEGGKIAGLRGKQKARYQLHLTEKPYEVVSVEEQDTTLALVDAAKAASEDPEKWQATLQALREAGVPLAAVTGSLYGLTAQKLIDGTGVSATAIVWTTDTIKVSLHTNTYTPNQDTDDFWNDATNEVSGTGYTTGGATLGTKASTYDTASDQIRLDAADTSWTSSTITARKAVVYKSTGTSTTSPLYGWVDFGADVSTTSGTFSITWDATGIVVYDVT